jgi:hypothetical protein
MTADETAALERAFPTVEHSPLLHPVEKQWVLTSTWLYARINFVAGPEKAGKSRLMQWLLASALTDGDNRLGIACGAHRPKRWLYLCAEESPGEVAQRLRTYAITMGKTADLLPISYHDASMMMLDRHDVRTRLERFMLLKGYDGLIIDPLRRVHMANENDNTAMAGMNNAFRRWCKLGITLLLVHHTGHMGEGFDPHRIASWLRGATDVATALDAATMVWRPTLGGDKVIVYRSGRFAPVTPVNVRDGGDPPRGSGWHLR